MQLAPSPEQVKLKPETRYIIFTCADELEKTLDGTGRYYETHGLEDAFHPQTILAYDMNGATLPIAHGAPLRCRIERSSATRWRSTSCRSTPSTVSIGGGNGGFWEDRGYDWYAGI